jgi:hypothetical protein
MAKYSNTIEYRLKTTADTSALSKLQSQIKAVQTEFAKLAVSADMSKTSDEILSVIDNLTTLQTALSKATNTDIGVFDLSVFTNTLKGAGLSLTDIKNSFEQCGVAGKQAFNGVIGTITDLDTKVRNTSAATDRMFNTIGNTVRWGVVASALQTFQNSIYKTISYFGDLDKSLNDIRIVTGQSASDMQAFAKYASQAAGELGKTTTDFTNASLIFAQQGYSQQRSNELATLTLKTANVTGQDTAEVSEQLTSLINGFQLQNESIGTIEAQVDKLAKVAAVGGADLEELATAESKVASTANTLGVTQDQLVSQLSTIISVTRQAPRFKLKHGRIASNCCVNCA